jgi:hypothetical protein
MVAHAPEEGEAALEAPLVEIVEENPADAARLVAMAEEEVFVAPLLEPRIDLRAEGLADLAGGAVEVDRVLLEAIIGGEVEAATCEKPTPACSNTAPSASTRDRPPPPPGRSQESSAKRAVPSSASTAEQMRS